MNALGPIADPNLRDTLQALKDEIFSSFNCHQVGKIVSFDPTTTPPTASVQLMMQRVVFNKTQASSGELQLTPNIIDYPVLVSCPVFCMTGAGFVLTLPVAAGDQCLVLFNDRDIDNWFSSGSGGPPNTSRCHDLSDGFALVGFYPSKTAIGSYAGAAAELRTKDATGKVSIAQALSLLTNGTETKIQVGSSIWVDMDTTSGKIGIRNAGTSLLTVLDSLVQTLLTWQDTHGDTPNATTLAALTFDKSQIDSLLK
jgi:hypothetical protein